MNIQCAGDYELRFTFRATPHGGGSATFPVFSSQHRFESGTQTLSVELDARSMTGKLPRGSFTMEYDTDYTVEKIEIASGCGSGNGGDLSTARRSVHLRWDLGHSVAGSSAGALLLESATITSDLYSPAALTPALGTGSTLARDGNGVLRQIKTAVGLVDIGNISASGYDLSFYQVADVGALDTATGLYALQNGATPFVSYRIENPDANGASRLRIVETRGSLTKETVYGYDSDSNTWSYSTGSGLRTEEAVVALDPNSSNLRTETIIVKNPDGTVASKLKRDIRTFAWGDEIVKEVLDPDGAALTTQTAYVETLGAAGYSQVAQRSNADGSWERLSYDSSGRLIKSVRPFGDSLVTDMADASHRVTTQIFDTIADADGDGTPEQRTTIVEATLGTETGRRYTIDWSAKVALDGEDFQRRSEILCTVAGAAWNASTNLVTASLLYGPGNLSGRSRRVIRPDGTATLTKYTTAADDTTTVVESVGAFDVATDAVTDGIATTTTINPQGQIASVQTKDIASQLELVAWTATQFDHLGRPTRLDYTDGTYETRDYACCGLLSSRDRQGNTTAYAYDRLGRVTDVTRDGLTTHTIFDADGRVKQVSRIGTDNSEIIQQKSVYDLAGRLTERRDAMDRLTTYAEEIGGTVTRRFTTTAPDNGTTIEEFSRDGSRRKIYGTTAYPRNYTFGMEGGLLFTKEEWVGDNGQTTEWTKSFTDFAGRSLREERPDASGTGTVTVGQNAYNAAGQLVSTTDADGVTNLFGYNARGEQEVTAIDMNANTAIDYGGGASDTADGTDRITKTTTSIATKTVGSTNYTVQRTVHEVWDTDHTDAATTVSISEQTLDGLRAWQTVPGPGGIAAAHALTATTVVEIDAVTATRTITTTTADQSKQVQVFVQNRLASTTLKSAANTVLNSTTLTYDPHGRLQTSADARNGETTYSWFNDDQPNTITSPDPDTMRNGDGYSPQLTSYGYDEAGRRKTVTLPDNSVTTTDYYPTGLVKKISGAQTYPVFYTYDSQGRLKTQKTWRDAASEATAALTTWNYNAYRGWLDNKRYADNTGPSYTYTAAGRLDTRQWARTPIITTTYVYSASGDLKGVDYSDGTPDVTVKFDRRGRAKEITDGSGTRTLAYETTGALKNEDYAAGILNTLAVHRVFDALGRLSELSSLGGTSTTLQTVEYTYGDASRLDTVKVGTRTATYAYATNSDLIESVTYKEDGTTRLTTSRVYDLLNRLGSVSNSPAVGAALSVAYRYNNLNQRTQAERENSTGWFFGYDAHGQVTTAAQRQVFAGAQEPGDVVGGRDFGYVFDDIGNRKSTATGVAPNVRSSTYTPNELNQYTQRTVPAFAEVSGGAALGTTVTLSSSLTGASIYQTERVGEYFAGWVPVTNDSTPQVPTVTVTAVKRNAGTDSADLVSTQSKAVFVPQTPELVVQDDDGNLTDDARWHYTWDGENRLVAMETANAAATAGVPKRKLEFGYDSQSRRVTKKTYTWVSDAWQQTESLRFLYDGWNLVAEVNDAGPAVRTYVWGLDLSGTAQGAGGVGGLLFATVGSVTHAPAFDGNGNILGYFELATGSRSATFDYAAFGEPLVADGAAAVDLPFRFSTKYTDRESGLLYYGLRYYSPGAGRWLSRDPAGEEKSENLYVFVHNATTERIDILGLKDCTTNRYNIDLNSEKFGALRRLPVEGRLYARVEITTCRACCSGKSFETSTIGEENTINVTFGGQISGEAPIPGLGIPALGVGGIYEYSRFSRRQLSGIQSAVH